MQSGGRFGAQLAAALVCWDVLLNLSPCRAQDKEQGRSIGKVSTRGDLIVLELAKGVLGDANLFDLVGRTVRFTPEGARYRIESSALRWDSEFGLALPGVEATLHQFAFPFSGRRWRSFRVGATGSIVFGSPAGDELDPYGYREGGISIGRFDQLGEAAAALIERAPAICVFLKPRLSGARFVKELPDRVVVTWDLTEPFGGLLDFGWYRTVNRFQAVLHRDGSIEMSYKELAAKDAIVGLYPAPAGKARASAVHLSAVTRKDGPFTVVYESFHYPAPPKPQDLSCTILQALGDRFDFLAYYSDFRIDSQEASTPSDGPVGGRVAGIGQPETDPRRYCTQGRLQQELAQPIYVDANEMQELPPPGAPLGGPHDITFYVEQLGKASPEGSLPYNYAVGHLGHEVGHRWAAYVSAKVGGVTTPLGQWPHWGAGLQAPVAFPYSLPTESSTMGGGAWQDNFDGTYTLRRDGFFVPAAGYSHLDLYLMGLISAAEVPDFFLLKNLVPAGRDGDGHPVVKAERTKVTIADVIAAEGPRLPDVSHSQKEFNTGIVVIVEHGRSPTRNLAERADGIRRRWIEYWSTATGHRASMTATPR